MAITSHALTAQELGTLQDHIVYNAAPAGEPADWRVDYMYENGMVTMRVENNNYRYRTFMNKRADSFGLDKAANYYNQLDDTVV